MNHQMRWFANLHLKKLYCSTLYFKELNNRYSAHNSGFSSFLNFSSEIREEVKGLLKI